MSRVILDNWSIEKISTDIATNQTVEACTEELHHLIEAILLWDDVCYLDNGYSNFWKQNLKGTELLHAFKPVEFHDNDVMSSIKFQYYYKYASKFSGIVSQGALEYMMICNHFGCGYFPSEERAKFIESQLPELQKIIFTDSVYNNMIASKLLDNEIQEHDEDYNLIKIKIPSIAQYVLSKSKKKTICDVLMTAMDMRDNRDIAKFRKDLEALSMRNERDYIKLKKQIDYNIKEISKSKSLSNLFWIELKAAINWAKMEGEFSVSPGLKLAQKNDSSKKDFVVNNVFLKKVIKNMI